MKPYLSKSRLMSARQCLKRLHLEVHRPELKVLSAATEAAFEAGHQVGAVARQLYGTEDAVCIPYHDDLGHALGKTARLIREGPKFPIFEATFRYGGVLVRVDVLQPDRDGWRIIEVKASTSIKEEHAFDCAVQSWVFQGTGQRLNGIVLAYVDNSFVYGGHQDYRGLLAEEDMQEEVGRLLPIVPEWIRHAAQAAGPQMPDVPVGQYCFEPYQCPFVAHCWPSEAEFPVQDLGGGTAKLAEFVREGYRDVRDVPASRLTEKQQWIQRVTEAGRADLQAGAAAFVAGLDYPRYYLDFESVMPPIPIWPGTRPYETIPIQWSCHYEMAPGELAHAEFLDLTGEPPMRRLAESLIRALGTAGPILMYTPYEKRMIDGLIERFPDLERPLVALAERLVDLAPITRQCYYHPGMRGSWSLKDVMPTINAELSYTKLTGIQEGTSASAGYLEAIAPDTSAARKAELKEQLLRYCRFDTEAMLRLVRFFGDRPDTPA